MPPFDKNFLTIGSPTSRRIRFWGAALRKHGLGHQLLDDGTDTRKQNFTHDLLAFEEEARKYDRVHHILTYEEVLRDEFPKISAPTVLRITSPGEDFELQKLLLHHGGHPDADSLKYEKGCIDPGPYWYRGWCAVLDKIEAFLHSNPMLSVMNTPAGIKTAFDKLACQRIFQEAGIATPELYIERVEDYDSLIDALRARKTGQDHTGNTNQTYPRNIRQIFIKPYHGSSASGVMALRLALEKQMLYTTLARSGERLFNHLRLQRYSDEAEIRKIINTMAPAGLLAEAWIPKKTFQGKKTDLRIMVINGKAEFVVPRMSDHIITNPAFGE